MPEKQTLTVLFGMGTIVFHEPEFKSWSQALLKILLFKVLFKFYLFVFSGNK
jgi:hypothetical protein